ncbi:MAG: DUF2218 domain-containing protein [Shimia thalassica]|uniref:DUF2218 domain-containing protein n=1 Tax=Shimia thalassica TaxID=1715693 RepID=UPI003297746E
MLNSTGFFQTENASRYLKQLCKHFAHKIEVEYDDTFGKCAFPTGAATLSADENGLTATVSAETGDMLLRAKSIVDSHLERFAFREEFKSMSWEDLEAS